MTATLQSDGWSGLQSESRVPISAIAIPMLERQMQISERISFVRELREKGWVEIPNAPFTTPLQDFIIRFNPDGDVDVIENEPTNAWPKIRFRLSPSQGSQPLGVDISTRPSDDTVEAQVLYTRVWYTAMKAGECRFRAINDNFPLNLRVEPDTEGIDQILYRAKLFRKLAFLEKVFNVCFQVPRYLPAEEIKKVEIFFRGVTEGEFSMRGSEITLQNLIPSDLNLDAPPFAGPGPLSRVVGHKEYLFGHWLDLGKVTIVLKHAELANPRILKLMREAPTKPFDLRFVVPDHQIIHRFSAYAEMRKSQRVARLNKFVHELVQNEPPELADTVRDLLVSDLSAESATQIASDWIILNRLPDRFSAQMPEIDGASGNWRVPLDLVYAGGEECRVGEVIVDIKTGKVIEAEPISATLERAQKLSETIVHAR